MTSISVQKEFSASVRGQLWNMPSSREGIPSHARKVIVDGAISGDPSFLQT